MKVITPPSSAEVNNAWSYAFIPPCTLMMCLIKHLENFAFAYVMINAERGYVITSVKNGLNLG
jgi:hypothetical protein